MKTCPVIHTEKKWGDSQSRSERRDRKMSRKDKIIEKAIKRRKAVKRRNEKTGRKYFV